MQRHPRAGARSISIGFISIGSIAIIACSLVAWPAAAADMPTRKAGLWELKITMEGGRVPPQTMQQCTDAAVDQQMTSSSGGLAREACAKRDVQVASGTVTINSVCKFGPVTMTSHADVVGDFDKAYTVKVKSKREGGPSIPGLSQTGETSTTIEAQWLGPCKADQKPGDMIMPNGMKMNIRDLPKLPGAQ